MSRHVLRRRAAMVVVLFATLALPASILAHAELETVDPADKSTVQGSPAEIVMTFAQNLDPAKSSIRVVDASGAVVVQGGTVPAGVPREMDLPIATPLAPGAYTIRWTTFSTEDGETARGTTTFTVEAAVSPPPTPTPAASVAPSAAPSAAPTPPPTVAPTPSAPPTTQPASTSDAVIPIVVALVAVAALGLWLLRGRSRRR